MTIHKAIEILHPYLYPNYYRQYPDFHDALQLAIEALKRLQDGRIKGYEYFDIPLPGETQS